MKLSVITDEVSQNLSVALDFAARHGLDGVELRMVAGRNPFEWDDADWRGIRAALKDSSMPLCALSLPLFKCALGDGEARAWQLARLPVAMERAAEAGAKVIRGFSFWNEPGDMPVDSITEAYRPVIALAERWDLTIALEHEPSVYTVTAARLKELLMAIGHPRVRALWDGGNLLFDVAGERPVPDGYETLREWIVHVHVKDAIRQGSSAHACPVGEGESDIPGQIALLKRDGYAGWMSLETHYRKRPLDERQLRLPAGEQFSEGGLEASEQSIVTLKAMLAS